MKEGVIKMDFPVKEGELVEVEIIDISHMGLGIAKIENLAIFVEGGLPGDKGIIKISELKKNYGTGEMVELHTPSTNRVKPECPVAHICGGCQMQELDYATQLEIKTKKVVNDIRRIGNLQDVLIHDTKGMDTPFRYRNKAQFPVGYDKDSIALGFYKRGSHDVVNTNSCIIQHDINDKVTSLVREFMEKYDVAPYNKDNGSGVIRHILTKTSFKTGDLMIIIVTNRNSLPFKEYLIEMLRTNIPNVKSIVQNINDKRTSAVLGNKTKTLFGDGKIVDYIGDLKFNISPESFFQVNPIQTEILYNKAIEYAALEGNEIVFDLYCGIGTISLLLAQKAKKVYGIEVVKQAVEDAKENAIINGIENVEFYDGTSEEVFQKLYKVGIKADVVVLDPPRKGCEESVLDTIIKMNPKKVVYISCNPTTLAKDLKYLDQNGYKTIEIQPVDMFPHTMHVETVVLMSRV